VKKTYYFFILGFLLFQVSQSQIRNQRDTPQLLAQDIQNAKRYIKTQDTAAKSRISKFLDSMYVGHINQIKEFSKDNSCSRCYESLRLSWAFQGINYSSLKIEIESYSGLDEPSKLSEHALFDLSTGREILLYDLVAQDKKTLFLQRLNRKLEEARTKFKACNPHQEDPFPETILEEQLIQLRVDANGVFINDVLASNLDKNCESEIRLNFKEATPYFSKKLFILN